MGLLRQFSRFISSMQEQNQPYSEACDRRIDDLHAALADLERIFSAAGSSSPLPFIDPEEAERWEKRHARCTAPLPAKKFPWIRAEHDAVLRSLSADFSTASALLPGQIHRHNEAAAQARLPAAYARLGTIEGHRPDEQQMCCIVKEAHNHLVLAGAGCGKTTVILGKIQYLLQTGACRPEEILVLSFTNASAAEMDDRLRRETGQTLDVATFHKLGLQIIRQTEGKAPLVTTLALRSFLREKLQEKIYDDAYLLRLSQYLLYNRIHARSPFSFRKQAEYREYLACNPPMTLLHEEVKSYGEMDIANFLTQNGIRYAYERPYPADTRTAEYDQYRPDFYLPDYNLYIEYFGISRTGEVPAYFSSRGQASPSETYREAMAWKRNLHRENHTALLELYAYDKEEGHLLDRLAEKLQLHGVPLHPLPPRELWKKLHASVPSLVDGILALFETILQLLKSGGWTPDDIRRRNTDNPHMQANRVLLDLVEPLYQAYEEELERRQEIDFHDMIHRAVQYVDAGNYVPPYRVVLVDEYQDISRARMQLLQSLRRAADFQLFCVGDDWQSIYRFAGSDIGYILHFDRFWGAAEHSKIETTYRFPPSLVQYSSAFIQKNPAQLAKSIRGQAEEEGASLEEISGRTETSAVEAMLKKLHALPKNSRVFFIGRYAFDSRLLTETQGDVPGLHSRWEASSGMTRLYDEHRPDLTLYFLTAHKSKGLQADYVFILNNRKARMGFPSKIQEAPLLELLLEGCDEYPDAEERRLFYVAMTRARKKVFLLTVRGQESSFIMELRAAQHAGTT